MSMNTDKDLETIDPKRTTDAGKKTPATAKPKVIITPSGSQFSYRDGAVTRFGFFSISDMRKAGYCVK